MKITEEEHPITEPTSYEERVESVAEMLVGIDNIEDATKLAKILVSLMDKAK